MAGQRSRGKNKGNEQPQQADQQGVRENPPRREDSEPHDHSFRPAERPRGDESEAPESGDRRATGAE
jgi:hypothetical protein